MRLRATSFRACMHKFARTAQAEQQNTQYNIMANELNAQDKGAGV
jgi:hypothetical protein